MSVRIYRAVLIARRSGIWTGKFASACFRSKAEQMPLQGIRKDRFMTKRNFGIACLLLALLLTAGCGASTAATQTPSGTAQVTASQAPAAPAKTSGTALESLGLADGQYQVKVMMAGGSGRASVASPAKLRIENEKAFATIVWSSSNYDYMKVDGIKYEPVSMSGNSAFEIPVTACDCEIPVVADTVAMSEPHEINYTLRFDSSTITPAKEEPAA